MLGDTGANALGAMLGVALVANASSRRTRIVAATAIGLTALGEFTSFSDMIDRSRLLRGFDRWGRGDR